MSVGLKIREIVKSKNVTPQQLGNMIGKTKQKVYDMYNERVSVKVDELIKIAKVLNEPVINFLIGDPDAYYDLVPKAIPIEEILKFMNYVHENAKEGRCLVNMYISKSKEGIYILEAEFHPLDQKLSEQEINKFGNQLYESYLITSPDLLKK